LKKRDTLGWERKRTDKLTRKSRLVGHEEPQGGGNGEARVFSLSAIDSSSPGTPARWPKLARDNKKGGRDNTEKSEGSRKRGGGEDLGNQRSVVLKSW